MAYETIAPATVEEIEEALARFRTAFSPAPLELDVEVETHGGGDFTIFILAHRPFQGWDAPYRVHAIYNDLAKFEDFINGLDSIEDVELQKAHLAELEEKYDEAVIAGMGDWNKGVVRLDRLAKISEGAGR